ncbi:diguanylate cyclase [Moorella naiadis]|uniref:bifunctional diguanylate cyclase/phosphohydrolase n=1 Tax=Moorella naiadis (nom. illeg.) TaxID=3093670 RepID=UPI003D9CA6DA
MPRRHRQREWERRIVHLSYHDALTGLYNRRYAEEWLQDAANTVKLPVAVIMADVNGLKLANDVFGHEEGDRLLKMAAEVLQGCLRAGDVICRWGGDEFLLLLPVKYWNEARTENLCRILAVANAFDAMTSDRPYRRAMFCKAAVAELKNNACSQFDPGVVAAFRRHLKEIEYCRNGGQGDCC